MKVKLCQNAAFNVCAKKIKKICARLWPCLITQCTHHVPQCRPSGAAWTHGNRSPRFAQFAQHKFAQISHKCRDRHRRAQPIICVPFWTITSSLCLNLSFSVSPSLSLLQPHQLRPVHKHTDRLNCPHHGPPKKYQKNYIPFCILPPVSLYFFYFFYFMVCW